MCSRMYVSFFLTFQSKYLMEQGATRRKQLIIVSFLRPYSTKCTVMILLCSKLVVFWKRCEHSDKSALHHIILLYYK